MKNKLILELIDVWKIYKMGHVEVAALRGVNLQVRKGEFLSIMGPSGSGKCVYGNTKVILDNGVQVQIKDLENKRDIKVMALSKAGSIKPMTVTNFYKRRVNRCLEIKTTSGKRIIVTKEHPFFTVTNNGFRQISAENLVKGDFIACARHIKIKGKSQMLHSLNQLAGNKSLIVADSPPIVKRLIEGIGLSRSDICRMIKVKTSRYDSWLNFNNIPLSVLYSLLLFNKKDITHHKLNLTALSSNKKVYIPNRTSPELLELLGYIVGDGNIDKDGIKITNIDKHIKKRIRYLYRKVFNVDTKEFIDKRIDCNSKVLISFFNKLFEIPLAKKSNTVKIPDFVFGCSNKEITAFIRGLFDCDSYVDKKKRLIEITLASKPLIEQLSYLLLRFGIISRYTEKIKYVSGRKIETSNMYYQLSVYGYDNLRRYNKYIGYNCKFKASRLKAHLKESKHNTNVDVIPCGSLIREIRRSSGVRLSRRLHDKLWPYERGIVHPSKQKLKQIIRLLEINKIDCTKLKEILKREVFWDKVNTIKEIKKSMFVYDVTVPGASNFVANGLIVHNSTAMNMIGCLDIPTQGHIYLEGKDIATLSESNLAQIRGKKIGFIFQQFNLINTLNALENVTLPMIFQNIQREEREQRAIKLLEMVGLGDRMYHKPTELSGGQQQRVAIARALAIDPDIVLADEPTGNLDSKTGHSVIDFLKKLHEEKGKTIIMVSHDEDVAKSADRIEYLKDGQIIKRK